MLQVVDAGEGLRDKEDRRPARPDAPRPFTLPLPRPARDRGLHERVEKPVSPVSVQDNVAAPTDNAVPHALGRRTVETGKRRQKEGLVGLLVGNIGGRVAPLGPVPPAAGTGAVVLGPSATRPGRPVVRPTRRRLGRGRRPAPPSPTAVPVLRLVTLQGAGRVGRLVGRRDMALGRSGVYALAPGRPTYRPFLAAIPGRLVRRQAVRQAHARPVGPVAPRRPTGPGEEGLETPRRPALPPLRRRRAETDTRPRPVAPTRGLARPRHIGCVRPIVAEVGLVHAAGPGRVAPRQGRRPPFPPGTRGVGTGRTRGPPPFVVPPRLVVALVLPILRASDVLACPLTRQVVLRRQGPSYSVGRVSFGCRNGRGGLPPPVTSWSLSRTYRRGKPSPP